MKRNMAFIFYINVSVVIPCTHEKLLSIRIFSYLWFIISVGVEWERESEGMNFLGKEKEKKLKNKYDYRSPSVIKVDWEKIHRSRKFI